MPILYIVRHAKSDHSGSIPDIDRHLNARGYVDAEAMSKLLHNKNIFPELIISSPAVRAITTSLIFSRNLKYDPSNIIIQSALYESETEDYLKVIRTIAKEQQSVMIFGHNPTITNFANALTQPFTDNIPTCGVIGIRFEAKLWKDVKEESGELIMYDFPKNHLS